jgi:hypothetical protein
MELKMKQAVFPSRVIIYPLGILAILGIHLTGCGSSPIHAVPISDEKNIWIEDPQNNGLNYCMANPDNTKADPICYPARRATPADRSHSAHPPTGK